MGADLYIKLKNDEDGYFRDSYNSSSVLWQYKLSWWRDIVPLQDDEGIISVNKIKEFLKMLKEKEKIFTVNLKEKDKTDKKYYQERAGALKKFLATAIELNSPIRASL